MTPTTLRTTEPIAGYLVTERLGAGGYGEVWKAEAPGGLTKAIKFIYGYLSDEKAARELKALNRIKQIRHPFLLSLERIEVIDGQLLIVTELADMSLKDRFQTCKDAGLTSIPREELIGYMRDAADGLDFLTENALQHLDVKPENLLLMGGRVKVADFGLVKDILDRTCSIMGGMTPVYAPPEAFDGRPSSHSDQYSLAIVYQEMLTATLPFPGTTAAQLATQHLNSRPRLDSLPVHDRAVIAKALSKNPKDRFASARAMVDALVVAGTEVPARDQWRAPSQSSAADRDTTSVGGQDTGTVGPTGRSGSSRPSFERRTPLRNESFSDGRAGLARLSESRTKTAPPPTGAPAIRDLEPWDVPTEEQGLRPTLFIGIGGTASYILRRLRRRLNDRFGQLSQIPIMQMLLIDTDTKSLSQATRADDRAGLHAEETLAMPLRPPQDYRAESPEILQWLSRRWLYNIPRSLQTEGLRPLGRLAMIDHASTLFERISAGLTSIMSSEAIDASEKLTGKPLRDRSPRVFVVSSLSGGTGSGMVLDVGYAVRMLLAELGASEDGLCGLLTHSTNRKASGKDLAIANTYACLSELYHYSRNSYPGEPACGLPAFEAEQATFPSAYFVHLGDYLNEGDFHQATDALAEYLYLDAATAGGRYFDLCRAGQGEGVNNEGEVLLRSFGICQLGCSQSKLPATVADLLCKRLLQRWIGEKNPSNRTESNGAAEAVDIQQVMAPLAPSAENLIDRFQSELFKTLPVSIDDFITTALVEAQQRGAEAAKVAAGTAQKAQIQSLRQLVGLDESAASNGDRSQVRLANVIQDICTAQSNLWQEELNQTLRKLADTDSVRLAGTQNACEQCLAHFRGLEESLNGELQHIQSAAGRTLTDNGEVPATSRWLGRASKPDAIAIARSEERLAEYLRLLLDQIVIENVGRFVRRAVHQLTTWSEQLVSARREINRLLGEFPADDSHPLTELETSSNGDVQSTRQAIARQLELRMPSLVAEFDLHVQQEFLSSAGGLISLLVERTEELQRFPTQLRGEARQTTLRTIQGIDIANIVVTLSATQPTSADLLDRAVQTAWPNMLKCGGAKRLLLVMPESPAAAKISEALEQNRQERSTVLFDTDCDIIACYEAEQLPLSGIAEALTYDSLQYANVAQRLHTRIDVNWSIL